MEASALVVVRASELELVTLGSFFADVEPALAEVPETSLKRVHWPGAKVMAMQASMVSQVIMHS